MTSESEEYMWLFLHTSALREGVVVVVVVEGQLVSYDTTNGL